MSEFFTWESLATLGGASVATSVITQFFKKKGIFSKIPTQIFSYIIALVILAAAITITGNIGGVREILIIPFNAVLVSLTANGEFSAVKKFKDCTVE